MVPEESKARFSLRARAASFRYAWAGLRVLLRDQHNARVHAAATVLVVCAGLVCRLRLLEWALLTLVIGMVWALEAVNTAIELLADEISPEQRPLIGMAKDVAAFGVLAVAIASVLIGCFVFLPHILA